MIKETIKTLQNYANDYNTITDNYKKSKEALNKNYIGEMLGEKEDELAETYNQSLKTIRETAIDEITNILTSQKEALKKSLEEDIPEEFYRAMNLYEGVTIDKNELEIIIEKYGNNYFASKEIKQLAVKNSIPITFISISDKLDAIEKLKQNEIDIIHNYKGKDNSYMHEVFIRGAEIKDISEYIGKNIEIVE